VLEVEEEPVVPRELTALANPPTSRAILGLHRGEVRPAVGPVEIDLGEVTDPDRDVAARAARSLGEGAREVRLGARAQETSESPGRGRTHADEATGCLRGGLAGADPDLAAARLEVRGESREAGLRAPTLRVPPIDEEADAERSRHQRRSAIRLRLSPLLGKRTRAALTRGIVTEARYPTDAMRADVMRVGFDVSALVRPHSRGVARATEGLTRALERRGRLEVVRLAPEDGQALRAWRQRVLPRAVRELGLAGIHSFTSAFPVLGPGRRVQTIHEVPWRHGVREGSDPGHRFWTKLGPLFADRVLVPSQHAARDLARVAPYAGGKIRVVPWGIDERFHPDPPQGEIDEVVLERYRLGSDPLLLVLDGGREKKNVDRLLSGVAEWKRLRRPRLEIVIAGRETNALRRSLGLASRLGLSGWVTTFEEIEERDLPALYRLSALVAVLSASEGFGFVVAEALASGTPVLVPPDSAQAELAGGAGIRVDPGAPPSVADGIERALEERDERRAERVARGACFSWTRSAELAEALWQELA